MEWNGVQWDGMAGPGLGATQYEASGVGHQLQHEGPWATLAERKGSVFLGSLFFFSRALARSSFASLVYSLIPSISLSLCFSLSPPPHNWGHL